MLGWTSVGAKEDAEHLAHGLIEQRLAVCVQVEGPLLAVYRWREQIEKSSEFRLQVKFLPDRLEALEAWLMAHHPYEVPEWIVVRAEHVAEKYLSWARANSTSAPL